MKRNVALAIDGDLLQKARLVCQRRNVTLTAFVRRQLEELIHSDEEYQGAIHRMAELMKKRPITVGERTCSRADLHIR